MANFNLNKVIIAGRLTDNPKLSTTPNGRQVVSFSLAINRRIGDKDYVAYPNCTAWGKTAEFISRYFFKGSSLCAVGYISTRSYDKNGEKRYVTEVVIDEAYFVDSRGESTPKAEGPEDWADRDFDDEEISTDDDLPF